MDARNDRRRCPRGGFTLVEVLIVMGLLTLLAGLVVVNVTPIFEGLGAPPLDRTLRQAVREARYQAAMEKETTFLRFDRERSAFVVTNAVNSELAVLETGHDPEEADIRITFFQLLPERGLRSGALTEERAEITRVRFQPDRSSTPFEAEIRFAGETTRHRYDPFSAVELRIEE